MLRGILHRVEFIAWMWAGQRMILYQDHLISMEEGPTYRHQIERARRRSRVSMRERRTRASQLSTKIRRISVSAELRKLFGEVEYSE